MNEAIFSHRDRAPVCVIGSGFAGATVAVELAAAGINVLVLEAGSEHHDGAQASMLDRIEVPPSTESRVGVAHQLGGTSNLWAGRMAPLEAIDFEPREWIAHSGWPITRTDLEPYFARGARILGVDDHGSFSRNGNVPPPLASGQLELKTFQWAAQPFNAAHYLRDATTGHRHLRVMTDARVIELRERENGASIEYATVAMSDGSRMRVDADVFVVAAGGIETPRLLLGSNAVRPRGIGNDYGVVGRYLATHPKANMATLVLEQSLSSRHALFSDDVASGRVVRCGLGFTAGAQRAHRLLNHYVQVLPFFEHRANRLFETFRGTRRFDSPLIERPPLIDGYAHGAVHIARDMFRRVRGTPRHTRKFVLRAFLDQYPNPANRVTLSDATDGQGMRLANLAWSFSPADRASVIAFFERLDGELGPRGARLDFRRLRGETDWSLMGVHSHFMGTTRMGSDPATAVVDRDCRVHGSENLFIAGPSLFTTSGYANPVYTVVALALRLADHIRVGSG